MKRILLSVLCLSFLSLQLLAQPGKGKMMLKANAELERRGEVYFSFEVDDEKELAELVNVISVDRVEDRKIWAYANRKEFEVFKELNYPVVVLRAPSETYPVKMLDSYDGREILEWDFYPTYEAYLDIMNQFVIDYPDICRIHEIGTLSSGRKLLSIVISDNVYEHEAEPEFMYNATMHGDETAGYVLMLRLIDYFLSNYGSDPRITNMVNEIEIHINPLANPDGTFAGGNHTVNGATRGNANYIDLNRNYPDPEDGPHPDGNPWQEETIAFMEYAEDFHFVMSANLHGGAELLNYPWDTWEQRHADDSWWDFVGYEYADTVHAHSANYFYGQGTGVTNGWDWYTTNGNRQDHMNYFHQCRECTIELSNVKLLPVSQLDAHWEYNYRSFVNYIEQTLYGVRGIVTDSETGDPVKAKVFIDGHDIDSSHVWSDEITGNYNRLLFEGNYDISFKSNGYKTKVIEDVNVENYQLVILNVELESGDLIADFEADNTIAPAGSSVHFFDKSYGNITSRSWIFEGGDPATSGIEDPVVTYDEPGNYDVSLIVSDGTSFDTLVRPAYISVNLEYLMDNGSVTTSSGLFYDSGGNGNNYSDNENYIMVFQPGEGCSALKIEFSSFNVEWESSCNYDWLSIYDGSSVEAPLIGTYCGTTSPGTVVATNPEGTLTFQFHSDSYVNEPGWVAEILCDSHVGEEGPEDVPRVSVYPNPAGDQLVIESDWAGSSESLIRIFNMNGRQVFEEAISQINTPATSIDVSKWPRGIYTLEFLSGERSTVKKIIVL